MTANGVEGTQNAAARLISWLDGFHRRDPGRSRPFKAVQGRARLSKAIDFPSATNSFARETYAIELSLHDRINFEGSDYFLTIPFSGQSTLIVAVILTGF